MNQDQSKTAPTRWGRIIGLTAVIAIFAIVVAACSGILPPAAPATDGWLATTGTYGWNIDFDSLLLPDFSIRIPTDL